MHQNVLKFKNKSDPLGKLPPLPPLPTFGSYFCVKKIIFTSRIFLPTRGNPPTAILYPILRTPPPLIHQKWIFAVFHRTFPLPLLEFENMNLIIKQSFPFIIEMVIKVTV